MTLSYEYLHKLFCPYDTWYEYRLNAITDAQKKEWTVSMSDYFKAVRRQVNREIKTAAMKIEAEIRDQRVLEEKKRRKR